MHGDPADVVAADLALAGVQSGADLDAEGVHCVANCHGAADRSLRAVERREEAVARGVHLTAAEAVSCDADDGVVRIEQGVPVAVAHLGGPPRRILDVGEKHRGEHAIVGHVGLVAGEELGDHLKRLAPRFDEMENVAPGNSTYFAPDMRSAISFPNSGGIMTSSV